MKTFFAFLAMAGALAAQSVTISAPVFTGTGLNDATSGGAFKALPTNTAYAVAISATGTPDSFKWQKSGGALSAAVPITGAAQTLADGVTIKFGATTGHTLLDAWLITANARGSLASVNTIQSGVGAIVRTAEDKARDQVSVRDFGAKGDGVTDDTAAWQAAIDSAIAAGAGAKVQVGPGTYSLTGVSIHSARGLEIDGAGMSAQIIWRGNTTTPVIKVASSSQVFIHGLAASFTASHPAISFINVQTASGGSASSSNVFQNLFIDTDHVAGTLTDAIVVSGVSGYDGNNDFMQFRDIKALGYSNAAIKILGSQSYSHQFLNCHFGENLGITGVEKYGVYLTTANGLGSGAAGSMQWRGGFMGTTISDFYADGRSDYPNLVDGLNSESAGRLLQVIGVIQGSWTIQNTRYSPYSEPVDPFAFIDFHGGSLFLTNSTFGQITGSAQHLKITYNNLGGSNSLAGLIVTGCLIMTSNQTLDALLNPVGSFSGGSDPDIGSYLTVTGGLKWQDPANPALGGFYAVSFAPQPSTPGILTVTGGVTQNLGSRTFWLTDGSGSVKVITGFGGAYTGMLVTVQIAAADASVSFSTATGHIVFASNPLPALASIAYQFICTGSDGTAANTYFALVSSAGR